MTIDISLFPGDIVFGFVVGIATGIAEVGGGYTLVPGLISKDEDREDRVQGMLRILIATFLLLGSGSDQVCAAVTACSYNPGCYETDAPHHSRPCKNTSCRPHGIRLFARTDSYDSRTERMLSGRTGAFVSQQILQQTDIPPCSVLKFMLFLPHPFPEAEPPAFIVNCSFLC